MGKGLLYLAILLGGLVTYQASVARGVDGIIVCPVLTSGDACFFDIEATADATLQVDTQANVEGEQWRVTVVEVNQTPAISNIGTGSTIDFTGIVQQPVINAGNYQVLVTREGPFPGRFPTSVRVRFDGPVTVSGPRPQGQPALSGRYAGQHSSSSSSFSIELSTDGSHVIRIINRFFSCPLAGSGTFDIDLSPGIPIIGQRFSVQNIALSNLGPFELDGLLDLGGVFIDADGFDGTLEQVL